MYFTSQVLNHNAFKGFHYYWCYCCRSVIIILLIAAFFYIVRMKLISTGLQAGVSSSANVTASGPQAFLVFKFLNAIIFISFYSQTLDQLLSESLLDHIMSLQNKRISRSTSFTTCISFLPGFKSIICFTESLLWKSPWSLHVSVS